MQIAGFQKLSLVDYPGKSCATIFTPGCTFRCPFCHNSHIAFSLFGSRLENIDEMEVFEYLEKRKTMLDGLCVSGGEPTLQRDVSEFIEKVKKMGLLVKFDTNGNNPEKLKELLDSKLVDYVAMDVKSSLENYSSAIGLKNFDTANVEKSIDILLGNRVDYEFRTTIVRQLHTNSDIKNMALLLKDAKLWRLQRFEKSPAVPDDTLSDISPAYISKIFEEIEIKPKNIIYY